MYFIIVSIFLILYTFFAWRYFQHAFYFLLFYIPFQLALNPPVAGIDIATGRVMILILFSILLVKEFSIVKKSLMSTFLRNCTKMWTFLKSDRLSQLLLVLLFWSGVSIFWSENWFWGLRKWLVFASIFPLYWVALYTLSNTDCSGLRNGLARTTRRRFKTATTIITVSGFFVALAALVQFLGQFVWDGNKVFHFWGRNFFPVFLGQRFGETAFQYQSWFVGISDRIIMRSVGFFPDPHTLGFYIGLVFSLILVYVLNSWRNQNVRNYTKVFGLVVIFMAVITTFLTFSRSAYLGFLASLFVFLILGISFLKKKRKLFLGFLVVIIIVFSFAFRTPVAERFISSFNIREKSNTERLSNFYEAARLIKRYPLHGTGLGSYSLNISKLRGQENIDYRLPMYAHNIYLDIWAEMGVVGLLAWLWIFIFIFYNAIRMLFNTNSRELENESSRIYLVGLLSALVWFMAQGFFDTPIFSPRVLPMLMIIFAMSLYFIKQHNHSC